MPATTPEQCDELFGRYVNEGNLEDLVALYEPQGTLVQQEGPVVGTAAIRKALSALIEMRAKLEMNVVRTVHGGGDVVALYNDWRMTGQAPDGSQLEMKGKALELVRKQKDGSWLFVIDDPFARD
jgi:uncharacterized protein (TIGR02246 family)